MKLGRKAPRSDQKRWLCLGRKSFRMGLFIGLLQAHGVTRLVDVRSFPRSRRNPHKLTAWARVERTKVDYPAVSV
jgi:uncharacterized protein (DUF488 family)